MHMRLKSNGVFPALAWLTGIYLVSAPSMETLVQYRFPKSKKRRICKKWAKRAENYKAVPAEHYYLVDNNTIVAHPAFLKELELGAEAMMRTITKSS